MKYKYLWAAFLPLSVVAFALKIYQLFFVAKGTFLSYSLSYVVLLIVALVFLFSLVFSLFERKSEKLYRILQNFFSGIGAFILSVAVLASTAIGGYRMYLDRVISVSGAVDFLLGIFAFIGFYFFGRAHITGIRPSKGASFFTLAPSVWACFKVVNIFINLNTASITVTDTTNLLFYIFFALFTFSLAVTVSVIESKNSVKPTIYYGFPFLTISGVYLICEIYKLIFDYSAFGISGYVEMAIAIFSFLYTLCVLIEIIKNVKPVGYYDIIEDKDELEKIISAEIEKEKELTEKAIEEDIKRGNFYVTSQNEDDTDREDMGTYGMYIGKTYVSGEKDGDVITPVKDSEKENFSDDKDKLEKIDDLLFEITAGKNDLDLNQMKNDQE